ncbi:MAG: galactonate dehydratase [Propionibacteriaceae bacterium]|nr:galactonate dehydratase [Micropruina sp.]HBX79766.1 galactonate dehydratase [Propionibacteriaceae bacterium]HBY24587.1 galactonate dehydratase [Propionibacteriaceae bacterium]
MLITKVTTYRVPPRWLFLHIETDEGISGWGEPVLEGHAKGAEGAVTELAELIVGMDPRRINDIWQMFFRNGCYRGGPLLMSAMSGIDTALWDILGKSLGVPVHALLGGSQRDWVRTYSWIGGDSPTNLVADAHRAAAEGFAAVKFNATDRVMVVDGFGVIDKAVQRIADLRDALGYEMDLVIDFHGRLHAPMAKVLAKELEPLHPLWIEDPVPADNPDAAIAVARSTTIPVAIGERVHSRAEFTSLLESRAFGVLNPDPAHMGGITQTVRLGAMAEVYNVALTPHCPLGPIALAACLQIDAVCHNAVIQEQSLGIHYNTGSDLLDYVIGAPFEYDEGYLTIPQGPGLGVEVNLDVVKERAAQGHDWRAPIWRHADGSVAEW